jgi:hypothetical protein
VLLSCYIAFLACLLVRSCSLRLRSGALDEDDIIAMQRELLAKG